MNSANPILDSKLYFINELPLGSRETYDLYQILRETFLNKSYDISQSWELQKALNIQNPLFEREFDDKGKEFEESSSFPEHWAIRYGFLATIKEKMIERVAAEGLEVKMCPYNYLGYNIAGVHISQNADVCLNEARSKIVAGDELILILFQYMLGKRKIVAMHDSKTLLAPTPKFDSHICEERPDPKEKESSQYIKSLVYLYEFANGNLDPVIRPRHCCPIAAMIFKNSPTYDNLNLIGSEQANMFSSSYQSPLSLLKPVSKHSQPNVWARQYLQSEFIKDGEEDIRKPLISEMEKEMYDIEKPTSGEESWRNMYQYQEGDRDMPYGMPKGGNRNGDSMGMKSMERDRSPERNKKWGDSSSRGGRSSRGYDYPRRPGGGRGAKNWIK